VNQRKQIGKACKVTFIGQGPNRTCWNENLKLGGVLGVEATRYAEQRCARLACTGKLGERVAALIGCDNLFRFHRLNLNARWIGRNGKGDQFDFEEGAKRARDFLLRGYAGRVVLLGKSVARCFGLRVNFLEPVEMAGKRFIVLPHPSGINLWWNSKTNVSRARRALRRFLDSDRNHTVNSPYG
jgi:hypothetical protein